MALLRADSFLPVDTGGGRRIDELNGYTLAAIVWGLFILAATIINTLVTVLS